ncbi:hypothetical protein [Micromonospora sp. NPDC005113]
MKTPSLTQYLVEFDRIGRSRDVSPIVVSALDADDLAAQIHRFARPYLMSRDVSVWLGMDNMRGGITCGFNNGGTFTLAEVKP